MVLWKIPPVLLCMSVLLRSGQCFDSNFFLAVGTVVWQTCFSEQWRWRSSWSPWTPRFCWARTSSSTPECREAGTSWPGKLEAFRFSQSGKMGRSHQKMGFQPCSARTRRPAACSLPSTTSAAQTQDRCLASFKEATLHRRRISAFKVRYTIPQRSDVHPNPCHIYWKKTDSSYG